MTLDTSADSDDNKLTVKVDSVINNAKKLRSAARSVAWTVTPRPWL